MSTHETTNAGTTPPTKTFEVGVASTTNSFSVNMPENITNGTIVSIIEIERTSSEDDSVTELTHPLAELTISGDAATKFTLLKQEGGTWVLKYTGTEAIDYESTPSPMFNLSFRIIEYTSTDDDAPIRDIFRGTLNVNVTNVDEPAVITPLETIYVDEDQLPGETLATLIANDPDAGQVAEYGLRGGIDIFNTFKIDATTGVIGLQQGVTLDHETQSSYELVIAVISSTEGDANYEQRVTVTLHINDVVENNERDVIQIGNVDTEASLGKVKFGNADGLGYRVFENGAQTESSNFHITERLAADGVTKIYELKVKKADIAADDYALSIESGTGENKISYAVTVKINGFRVEQRALSADVVAGHAVTIELGNDVTDGDELLAVSGDSTDKGSYTVDGGKLIYTAKAGTSGTDTITVDVTDGFGGGTAQRTITINIDPPPAISGELITYEDNPPEFEPVGFLLAGGAQEKHNYTIAARKKSDTATSANNKLVSSDNTTIEGEFGTLYIDQDGHWDYHLNNDHPRFAELHGDGSSEADTFTIDFTHGTTTFSHELTITIYGRTDTAMSGSYNSTEALHLESTYSGPQINYLYGSNASDRINGGTGNDSIRGYDGDDYLYGDDGNDTLYGDNGNDYLYGGSGDDWLIGWDDDDILNGGEGNDNILAGLGDDIFVLSASNEDLGVDFVIDFTHGGIINGNPRFTGGDDKIRVDIDWGSDEPPRIEDIKAGANIRWTNDSNHGDGGWGNDPNKNDTIIYRINDTGADWVIMVLEDFTEELFPHHFEVV